MMMMMMMLICRMLVQFSPGGEYTLAVCQTIHRIQTTWAAQTLLYMTVIRLRFLVLVSETPRRSAQCSPRGVGWACFASSS
ncbi:hypothetical protein V8F06_008234 [Rhypophila decipiens]